jgi:hypothetical protein
MRLRPAGILALLAGAALGTSACGGASMAHSAVVIDSAAVAAAQANPVTVSPLPGTMDASPATQISFLGGPGTSVSHVRVVGSRSGVHGGVLRSYSTGTGESFLPASAFAEGERVTVSARVVSSSGGAHTARTSFTIAHQAPIAQKQFPLNPGDAGAVQHYSSAPDLAPSKVTITTPAQRAAAPGELFLAPYQGVGEPGPMIVDQAGNLVWFHRLPADQTATNFGVQRYQGAPALVWWQGRILQLGFGQGEDVIYDASYRPLASIRAGNGYRADLHVIKITPQGTAWIDAYDPVKINLAASGGAANGVLSDSLIQEVDIKTGLVMWEWHALGHIPFGDSKNPLPSGNYPWDYVHVNSVDPGPHGDVLVSFRNTWSLDDIDIHSGGFRWRIGGAHSTFKLAHGATFYWQHDAAFQPGGTISLFDNGSDPPEEKQSRGLLLSPNFHTHTVTLARQFVNPARTLLAESQGDARVLPGGNWLIGYGRLPNFSEFDASGQLVLDGTLGREVQSFTVTLSVWDGQPAGAPSILAQAQPAGGMSVSVSWNGATRVASWRVLAGSSAGSLAQVATVAKSGFQTTIALPAAAGPFVMVQALDAAGAVLGVSPTSKP